MFRQALVLAMWAFSACGSTGGSTGVARRYSAITAHAPSATEVLRIRIVRPHVFWRAQGFVELVPPIRLPTTHDERDVIRVLVRVPRSAVIELSGGRAGEPPTLAWPPGTRVDRVEFLRSPSDPNIMTAMDVRGMTVLNTGAHECHVLRPTSNRPNAELEGWSWRCGTSAEAVAATWSRQHAQRLHGHSRSAGLRLNRERPSFAAGVELVRGGTEQIPTGRRARTWPRGYVRRRRHGAL